jgi:2-oxoisovalerate dehydrogenase E1 component
MPRDLVIDPKKVRKSDVLKIDDIPINQYKSDYDKEVKEFSEEGLKKMYYDMLIIRHFETMLDDIKTKGSHEGIEYEHRGPAHLSIGQESSAVGQAVHLGTDDFIFGSHRSHGEILSKCFSAIARLDEDLLMDVMKSYHDGAILKIVDDGEHDSGKDLAEDFVLYGTLAEIFARENGFNRGLGGSMHAFFAPFGSMPNNAIVGGSADIAAGSALYKRVNKQPGMVIANIGDASTGCGPVWEAMVFSSMAQYREIWPKETGGAPPIIFNFMNNFYGMGGQTFGETMGYKILARIGSGLNPENMHAERVDGYNPLAVADAIRRKREILEEGKGPVLLDTITYRVSGHSPSDASSYRTKEEIKLWEESDCLDSYKDYLKTNNTITKKELDAYEKKVSDKIVKALKLASDLKVSPRVGGSFVEDVMFSNQKVDRFDDREPEALISKEENPRVNSLKNKARYAYDEDGKELPKTRILTLRDALFEAMLYRFYKDPTMVAYGEENRDWGGAFAVYRGLTEAIPHHRLFNAPISEGAIAGSGVGYALSGGRAVVELMYCDFMGRAGDEIFNQAAKWQSMSAGVLNMPLVIRVSVGNKYGAQHSQDWTSIVAHIPGLKVMFPATPYDAKGMLNLALRGSDPVVFFESQRLYGIGEQFVKEGVPEHYYEIPEGEPVVRRNGTDLTICTIGATLYVALEAADELEEMGISVEVIDLRFINPLDMDPIVDSVKKTGKILLSSDACERGSYLHTVASNINQITFDYLDGPPVVLGSRNWITPSAEMENLFFPQKQWILDAIHERILPLPDHKVTTVETAGEIIRRYQLGV